MSVDPIVIAVGMALPTRIGGGGTYLTEVLPAVPAEMASAVNNDIARGAGLISVAVLPPRPA